MSEITVPHRASLPPGIELTGEQRHRIGQVRELVQGQFKARGKELLDGSFPWDNMRQLADIGVLGMAVGKSYGGSELGVFDTALVLEEIAKGCYITAMAVLGEVGTQTRVISAFAPEHIKRKILPQVCTGDCVLSICLTEPHAGTDVASYTTNAWIRGDKVVINGTKSLISRAEEAGMFVVFTRVDDAPGLDGIGCALVEQGTPGLALTSKVHTLGGENLHEVTFTDCEVPLDHLVVRQSGLKSLLSAFNTQRCLNPSISLGLAEGAFDEAVSYAGKRRAFGRSIGDFQGMRWKLADMYIAIEAARGLLYRACLSANPFPDALLAATAKIRCNEMSLDVTSEALQIHGGFGFTDDSVVSRLYRGARYGTLGGGTSETLRDLIGKRVTSHFDEKAGIAAMATW
ncbi:acyl-CoA dehydrogenase family protein [Dyella sp.]|uniref:acyl-CoA dehydrogenase family protein n=1 Tax=Dyella sp. TaxID=1869338 RepID=UPI002ED2BD9E